jgi:hypothetical protein
VVVFPLAFHIAVQQPFRPLWSRLLLHDHEPSRATFALCFKSLLISLLPASGEVLLDFPSPRHLSSSDSYPLDLSGLGDPTGINATAGLALRVTGTHKPLYHGKVEIPIKGTDYIKPLKSPVILHVSVVLRSEALNPDLPNTEMNCYSMDHNLLSKLVCCLSSGATTQPDNCADSINYLNTDYRRKRDSRVKLLSQYTLIRCY